MELKCDKPQTDDRSKVGTGDAKEEEQDRCLGKWESAYGGTRGDGQV